MAKFSFDVEDFTSASTSALPKEHNGILVNYAFEGVSEAQITWMMHDSATRLFAQKFARAGRDAAVGTVQEVRWSIAKREKRSSFHLKDWVPNGVRVSTTVLTPGERMLALMEGGMTKDDAMKTLFDEITESAEKISETDAEK